MKTNPDPRPGARGRHPFTPGRDALLCAVCGQPYQSVTKGSDPNHPMDRRGRSTR
jgi:hypothetical protein